MWETAILSFDSLVFASAQQNWVELVLKFFPFVIFWRFAGFFID